MIIDCFNFYNEEDLLLLRLQELKNTVNFHILVEAEFTQSLQPKPLYFNENKDKFKEFLPKIIHVILKAEECPNNDGYLWRMEHFQRREGYKRGLSQLHLGINDIIHASDLDEIPSADAINEILQTPQFNELKCCVLDLNFYAYFMNLKCVPRNWVGGSLTKASIFLKNDPHYFTDNRERLPRFANCGNHFSWLGGAEKVWQKAHHCIEPYDKSTIPSKEEYIKYFNEYIKKEKKFFIKTESLEESSLEFKQVELNNNYPKFVLENMDIYGKYFLK